MTSQHQTNSTVQVFAPVHCISCNITFSSQAHLDAHLPCSNTNFDLSKVKTEIEDPQPADSSTDLCTDMTTRPAENSASPECLPAVMHIKQEIKSEAPDSSTSEPVLNVVLPNSNIVTQQNQKSFRESSRGRRGKIGGRGRGGRQNPMDTVNKSVSQELSLCAIPGSRGSYFKTRYCNISAKKKTSPIILPKLQAKPSGSDIKINGVYYTLPKKTKDSLPSSSENPSVVSVPVSAVVNAPSVSQATIPVSNTISLSSMNSHRTFPSLSMSQTALSIPSTIPMSSVNAMGTFPILPTQNIINPLPFGSVMFGNNIMSNPQQAPILWGNTTPIFNPLQAINPIQTNSAVIPGLQSINLPQPLQSIPNFALPLNQNILQVNSFQAVSSAVPSNTETTINASKTSNSNSGNVVLPPNPVSQKVPLLVGNQLIFLDPPSSTPMETSLLQENNLSISNLQASQPHPQLFQSSSQLSTKPVISFTSQSTPVLITSSSTSQNAHKVIPTVMSSPAKVTTPNSMPLNPENTSNNVSTSKSLQKLSTSTLSTPKLPLPSQVAVAKLCRKYRGRRRGRPPNVKTVQNTMRRRLLSNVTDTTESKSSSDTETTGLVNQVTASTCTCANSLVTSMSAPVSVKHSTLTPTQSAKMANLENKISNLKSTALKQGLGSPSTTCPVVTTQPSWAPTALAAVISSLSAIDAMASSLTKVSTTSPAISPAPSPKTSNVSQVTTTVMSVVPTTVSSVTTTTATTSSSIRTSAGSEGLSVTSPVKSSSRSTKTVTTASTTSVVTQQKVPILPAGKVKIAPAPSKKPVTIPILITACTASSVKTSSAPQALVSLGTNTPAAPSPGSSGHSLQNIVSPSSITPIIQPPTLFIPPQLQQTQQTTLPYVHNLLNLGAPQVPLFSNTIGIPGPNFVMDSSCGQNMWLQNVTNNQATVIGSNNNQQPLLLASPVKSAVVTTQNSHAMISARQESCLPSLSHFSNIVSTTASQAQKDSDKTTIATPSKTLDDAGKVNREETPETTDTDKERDSARATESVGKHIHETNTSTSTKRKVDETSLLYSLENKKLEQNEDNNLMSNNSKKVDNEVNENPVTSSKTNLSQAGNNDSSTSQGSSLNKKEKKPLLTEYFDPKTGLLQKQILSQSNAEDKSGKLIPKPTTELDSLFSDQTASRSEKGQMFLGPLTKKELEKIMRNPDEIGKYFSVPSGQILITSKALAVPTSSAPIRTTSPMEKTLSSQNMLSGAGVIISSVSSLSPFLLNSIPSVASVANTYQLSSVCSGTVDPKVSYAPIVPKGQTISNVAQTSSQRLLAPDSVYMTVSRDDVAKSSVAVHHPGPSKHPKRKKFLSIKRRQELMNQKHQSDLMKLSFIGDIGLLKDSLRKCTVNLQQLPVDIAELSARGHQQKAHNLSRKPSEFQNRQSVPKQDNNPQNSQDEQSMEDIIPHRNQRNSQKQWVPVEVLGDLTIRGRLLDSNAESEGQGMRRSTRISALPKLDYADLERRPFQDLDDNSDSDFDADEGAFEIVTDIEEEIEEQSVIENSSGIQEQSAGDNLDLANVSSCNSTLNKKEKISVILPSSSTVPTTSSNILTNPGVSKETVDILSSFGTENENEPSQPEPSSPIKTPPEPMDCEVETVHEEKAEAVLENTPVHEDKDQEGCHYSSESDSDIYEPSVKFSSKAEKKKYLFKRHSEVTMFLIKHAGKFHSVDDEDAHYCDVCKQYKTNGIFSLAKHLKIHL